MVVKTGRKRGSTMFKWILDNYNVSVLDWNDLVKDWVRLKPLVNTVLGLWVSK